MTSYWHPNEVDFKSVGRRNAKFGELVSSWYCRNDQGIYAQICGTDIMYHVAAESVKIFV
jgi:hypothetical protein